MKSWTGRVATAAIISVAGGGVCLAQGGPVRATDRPAASSRQAPGGSIVSFVRDQAGRPLPSAIVSVVGRRIVTSLTDDLGRCTFGSLPAGDYLVRVHRSGYVSSSSLIVLAGPGANTTWSFVLKPQLTRAVDPRTAAKSQAILSAGFVGSEAALQPAKPEVAEEDEASHDHSEVAWRLKHLKRSVLKEATPQAIFDEEGDPAEFDRAVADMFTRQTGPAEIAASLLSHFPLAGQVNLLTTGAFDSPQQLVSAGSLARGVAMVSLGASAGSRGDWAVQGAMTQGDVASWMVSGSYLTRAPARHVYDVGMSYSLQRYDGSNPSALAAVSDGNRFAGVVYGFDSWSINDHVSLAYGARYAKYGYLENSLISPRAPTDRRAGRTPASQRRRLAARAGAWRGRVRAVDGCGDVAAAGADASRRSGARRSCPSAHGISTSPSSTTSRSPQWSASAPSRRTRKTRSSRSSAWARSRARRRISATTGWEPQATSKLAATP